MLVYVKLFLDLGGNLVDMTSHHFIVLVLAMNKQCSHNGDIANPKAFFLDVFVGFQVRTR